MTRATRAILPIFFLIVTLVSLWPHAYATSYYNWVSCPSFSPLVNICEDGTFESGSFSSGVLYGNWTSSAGASTIQSSVVHEGVYSSESSFDGGDKIRYTFADPPLESDIEDAVFYYRAVSITWMYLKVYYTDTTSDQVGLYDMTSDSSFHEMDLMTDGQNGGGSWWDANVDTGKLIEYIEWYPHSSGDIIYLDNVVITIDDGSGQSVLSTNSNPWYLAGAVSSNYVGIVDDFGRTDDYSCRFSSYAYDNYKIMQDLDYFDADLIEYISLYAYSAINASEAVLGIECELAYTDGTVDTMTEYLTNETPGWELLDYGQAWIDDTKFIQSVRFKLDDDSSSQTIWIDDVAVYTETGMGASRFTWTTSPEPQDKISTYAQLYMSTTYTFYGTVYNSTGTANQNGTATITTAYGQTTADISLGAFNFTLAPRTGTADVYENIGIVMALDDPETLTVSIQFKWDATGSTGGFTNDDDTFASQIGDFMVIFLVTFVPALLLGFYMKSAYGFVGGLVLGTATAFLGGLVPVWFVFLSGLVLVALLFIGRKTFSGGE